MKAVTRRLSKTILLLAVLTTVCGAAESKKQQLQQYSHKTMTVAGTPSQIGTAIGTEHKKFINEALPVLRHSVTLSTMSLLPTQKARAREIGKHIDPVDVAEMTAIAKAAGLPYEDVLYMNVYYNLIYNRIMCRQVCVWGNASANGKLIHARNLDWPDLPMALLRKNNLILTVRPDKGIEHLVLTWPGMVGVLTGTNKSGITVAYNQLVTRRRGRISEPVFFTIKRILRTCTKIEQAVAIIKKAKPLGNGSVMISDTGAGKAVVVEITDEGIGVRQGIDSTLGNANDRTVDMRTGEVRYVGANWPCDKSVRQKLPLTVDQVRSIMASQDVLQSNNLLTVIFVPEEKRMLLSCGRYEAARGKFTEYKLFTTSER